jgi:hypothetical protein
VINIAAVDEYESYHRWNSDNYIGKGGNGFMRIRLSLVVVSVQHSIPPTPTTAEHTGRPKKAVEKQNIIHYSET